MRKNLKKKDIQQKDLIKTLGQTKERGKAKLNKMPSQEVHALDLTDESTKKTILHQDDMRHKRQKKKKGKIKENASHKENLKGVEGKMQVGSRNETKLNLREGNIVRNSIKLKGRKMRAMRRNSTKPNREKTLMASRGPTRGFIGPRKTVVKA